MLSKGEQAGKFTVTFESVPYSSKVCAALAWQILFAPRRQLGLVFEMLDAFAPAFDKRPSSIR